MTGEDSEQAYSEEITVEAGGLSLRVVLVEPASEGNVGSVCRAMKNFGFNDLWLVRPCALGDFAKAMASHAGDVLEEVITVGTLEEALQGCDLVVGTTGKPGESTKKHLRVPYFTPPELRTMLEDKAGRVALLFGREDCGLSADELARCDVVVNIPASAEYPILNISHAAAIVLYELAGMEGGDFPLASGELLELLYRNFESLLTEVNHPEHKRDKTLLMLRRIIGRAMINQREYFTLMGVLRDIELALARMDECDTSWVENN
ncbi:MAG TPA: RNA methyltransferase [Methanocella sp.]|nr:RNA methyltransferase [Methanocella sp.]